MDLFADQLRRVYEQVKGASRYSEWLQHRGEWYARMQRWVNPELGGLNDEQLRSGFLEFFSEGGGVQNLNKVWRDRIIRDIRKFRQTVQHILQESAPVDKRSTGSSGAPPDRRTWQGRGDTSAHGCLGRIDLLARDRKNNWVIIELKKGRSAGAVLGQILRYMGWVKANLATGTEEVRGIILVGEGDRALSYAVTMTSGVELYTYHLQFHISRQPGV